MFLFEGGFWVFRRLRPSHYYGELIPVLVDFGGSTTCVHPALPLAFAGAWRKREKNGSSCWVERFQNSPGGTALLGCPELLVLPGRTTIPNAAGTRPQAVANGPVSPDGAPRSVPKRPKLRIKQAFWKTGRVWKRCGDPGCQFRAAPERLSRNSVFAGRKGPPSTCNLPEKTHQNGTLGNWGGRGRIGRWPPGDNVGQPLREGTGRKGP